MQIWETFQQIWNLRDLRRRILITIILLLLARVLAHVPLPGVDLIALRDFFARNQIFGLFNMFSGGSLSNFSIIMMGVGPYISASIIFQLLTMVIPSLEELSKEGQSGQEKINYWTRILAVPLGVLQAYFMLKGFQGQGVLGNLQFLQLATMIIAITSGTILLMWIGELISESGIGNGVSLIITLGIIAGLPAEIRNTAQIVSTGMITSIVIFILIFIAVITLIVIANEGVRQIPVSYARRIRGLKSYGGIDTHIPIRVNSAGVIPIIFALSIVSFPAILGKILSTARTPWVATFAVNVANFFQNTLYQGIIYFILVVLFTYFYTGVVLKPDQMAENLQKQGGFVPGMRPGKETANYLSKIIVRITLSGAIFLGIIAVLPYIIQSITHITTLVIGGTGILIMVSVIIDTMRQIQAQLSMHSYEKY